jgi:NADH:ubiquinone oxidoreductase subunit B-like Fe-S oxidoreductase
MYFIAEQRLGPKLRAHEKARGRYASLWKAAGIGLACCIVDLVLVFTLALVLASTGVISLDE